MPFGDATDSMRRMVEATGKLGASFDSLYNSYVKHDVGLNKFIRDNREFAAVLRNVSGELKYAGSVSNSTQKEYVAHIQQIKKMSQEYAVLKETLRMLDERAKPIPEKMAKIVSGFTSGTSSIKSMIASITGLDISFEGLKRTLLTFNQAQFDGVRISERYGESLADFQAALARVQRTTIISQQGFATLNKLFKENFLGIPPTAAAIANLATVMQNRLGYSEDVIIEKTRDLISLQNQIPFIFDRINDAMKDYAAGNMKSADSVFMIMRAWGATRPQIESAMNIMTSPTGGLGKTMEFNKRMAEAAKTTRDAQLDIARDNQKSLETIAATMAKAAQFVDKLSASFKGLAGYIAGAASALEILKVGSFLSSISRWGAAANAASALGGGRMAVMGIPAAVGVGAGAMSLTQRMASGATLKEAAGPAAATGGASLLVGMATRIALSRVMPGPMATALSALAAGGTGYAVNKLFPAQKAPPPAAVGLQPLQAMVGEDASRSIAESVIQENITNSVGREKIYREALLKNLIDQGRSTEAISAGITDQAELNEVIKKSTEKIASNSSKISSATKDAAKAEDAFQRSAYMVNALFESQRETLVKTAGLIAEARGGWAAQIKEMSEKGLLPKEGIGATLNLDVTLAKNKLQSFTDVATIEMSVVGASLGASVDIPSATLEKYKTMKENLEGQKAIYALMIQQKDELLKKMVTTPGGMEDKTLSPQYHALEDNMRNLAKEIGVADDALTKFKQNTFGSKLGRGTEDIMRQAYALQQIASTKMEVNAPDSKEWQDAFAQFQKLQDVMKNVEVATGEALQAQIERITTPFKQTLDIQEQSLKFREQEMNLIRATGLGMWQDYAATKATVEAMDQQVRTMGTLKKSLMDRGNAALGQYHIQIDWNHALTNQAETQDAITNAIKARGGDQAKQKMAVQEYLYYVKAIAGVETNRRDLIMREVELTKTFREGYLDAMTEQISMLGDFGQEIGTMETGVPSLIAAGALPTFRAGGTGQRAPGAPEAAPSYLPQYGMMTGTPITPLLQYTGVYQGEPRTLAEAEARPAALAASMSGGSPAGMGAILARGSPQAQAYADRWTESAAAGYLQPPAGGGWHASDAEMYAAASWRGFGGITNARTIPTGGGTNTYDVQNAIRSHGQAIDYFADTTVGQVDRFKSAMDAVTSSADRASAALGGIGQGKGGQRAWSASSGVIAQALNRGGIVQTGVIRPGSAVIPMQGGGPTDTQALSVAGTAGQQLALVNPSESILSPEGINRTVRKKMGAVFDEGDVPGTGIAVKKDDHGRVTGVIVGGQTIPADTYRSMYASQVHKVEETMATQGVRDAIGQAVRDRKAGRPAMTASDYLNQFNKRWADSGILFPFSQTDIIAAMHHPEEAAKQIRSAVDQAMIARGMPVRYHIDKRLDVHNASSDAVNEFNNLLDVMRGFQYMPLLRHPKNIIRAAMNDHGPSSDAPLRHFAVAKAYQPPPPRAKKRYAFRSYDQDNGITDQEMTVLGTLQRFAVQAATSPLSIPGIGPILASVLRSSGGIGEKYVKLHDDSAQASQAIHKLLEGDSVYQAMFDVGNYVPEHLLETIYYAKWAGAAGAKGIGALRAVMSGKTATQAGEAVAGKFFVPEYLRSVKQNPEALMKMMNLEKGGIRYLWRTRGTGKPISLPPPLGALSRSARRYMSLASASLADGGMIDSGSYVVRTAAAQGNAPLLNALGSQWVTGGIPGRDSVPFGISRAGGGLAILMPGEAIVPPQYADIGESINKGMMHLGGYFANGGGADAAASRDIGVAGLTPTTAAAAIAAKDVRVSVGISKESSWLLAEDKTDYNKFYS